MAVPKRKTSRSVTKQRRSHLALAKPNLTPCGNCGELTPSHRVCPKCGEYDGKVIVQVED